MANYNIKAESVEAGVAVLNHSHIDIEFAFDNYVCETRDQGTTLVVFDGCFVDAYYYLNASSEWPKLEVEFDTFLSEMMNNNEFKTEYDSFQEEFEQISADLDNDRLLDCNDI